MRMALVILLLSVFSICVYATPEADGFSTAPVTDVSTSTLPLGADEPGPTNATDAETAATSNDSVASEEGEPNRIVHYLGKLHPVTVHFPIAFLILAAVVEAIALVRCKPICGETAQTLLAFGVAASLVAIATGWANASYSEHIGQEATVELHRWLGIAASATALAAYALGLALRRYGGRTLRATYLMVLIAAAIGIGLTGHLGGELVYGEGYLKF